MIEIFICNNCNKERKELRMNKEINWTRIWFIAFFFSLTIILFQKEIIQEEEKELWARMKLEDFMEYRSEIDNFIISILKDQVNRLRQGTYEEKQ